jgi:hypothetical protein
MSVVGWVSKMVLAVISVSENVGRSIIWLDRIWLLCPTDTWEVEVALIDSDRYGFNRFVII